MRVREFCIAGFLDIGKSLLLFCEAGAFTSIHFLSEHSYFFLLLQEAFIGNSEFGSLGLEVHFIFKVLSKNSALSTPRSATKRS